jgi:hypothetical protein
MQATSCSFAPARPASLRRAACVWHLQAANWRAGSNSASGLPIRRVPTAWRFQRIPHSASSVTIVFRMEGSGESIDNESWGIDNLRVIVHP